MMEIKLSTLEKVPFLNPLACLVEKPFNGTLEFPENQPDQQTVIAMALLIKTKTNALGMLRV